MPHPRAGGQGGQGEGGEGEGFIHGGNEDLSLVVGGDQDPCSSVISSEEYNSYTDDLCWLPHRVQSENSPPHSLG